MSLRTSLLFLLAISSGLLAAAGVTQMRSSQLTQELSTVLMVKKPILRGAKLEPESLIARKLPVEYMSSGMAASLDEVVGCVAMVNMVEGEFVMKSKVTSKQANSGIASLVPLGMRAKSITAVTPADRISGLLKQGDRVDVLLTRSTTSPTRRLVGMAETLLQNIEVLAIDNAIEAQPNKGAPQSNTRNDNKPSSITLLVTPDQASLLSLAQKEGTLSFSLRNPEDQSQVNAQENPARFLDSESNRTETASDREAVESSSSSSETIQESEESLTSSEFQLLHSDQDETEPQAMRIGAIRTIRGSRVGVVPIRSVKK